MITFYPGPSKVYPQVEQFLQDAYKTGVLSMNHRSEGFMEIMKQTQTLLHQKLNIPDDYSVYFTSSATECWEIIAQSLTKAVSLHGYNGAFGKKWMEYAAKIVPLCNGISFDIEQDIREAIIKNSTKINVADVICLTHNETSNGTAIGHETYNEIRKHSDLDAIIAVDVTSSIGGELLDWPQADVWFGSVQKCLGLPAGMAIMVCSPKAMAKAVVLGENKHYNSLLFIDENFKKYQTHYTPNTLSIYLLMRLLEHIPDISTIHRQTLDRAKAWYHFIENETNWEPLVKNDHTRSKTVIAVEGSEQEIKNLKIKAASAEIMVGNGYGNWKNNTFRIANFPAIEDWEIEKLKLILK